MKEACWQCVKVYGDRWWPRWNLLAQMLELEILGGTVIRGNKVFGQSTYIRKGVLRIYESCIWLRFWSYDWVRGLTIPWPALDWESTAEGLYYMHVRLYGFVSVWGYDVLLEVGHDHWELWLQGVVPKWCEGVRIHPCPVHNESRRSHTVGYLLMMVFATMQ